MKIYNPESARGEIARHIEDAARDFGPEKLTRDDIARCLLLEANEISDAEWTEISEFAVNAGTDVVRAMFKHVHPEPIDEDSLIRLEEPERAKGLGYSPQHDVFHAAEAYRLSNGVSAAPTFFSADRKGRYLQPRLAISELYVELFEAPTWLGVPLPVALRIDSLRKRVNGFYSAIDYPEHRKAAIHTLLTDNIPQTTQGWIALWEAFIEILILGNAEVALGSVSAEDESAFRKGYAEELQHPPEHYIRFAARIFDKRFTVNNRLFLEELLACIRVPIVPKS